MRKLSQFLFWIIVTVTASFALTIAAAAYLLLASVPDYDESFNVPDIAAPVNILRDSFAIPHISGKSDRDIFFGVGFAHAQDRLGQMLRLRNTAAQNAVPPMRAALNPVISEALVAYANGVNAWIDEVAKGRRGRGAPEFYLSTKTIKQWNPSDSLDIAYTFLTTNTSDERWVEEREIVERLIPPNRPKTPELLLQRAIPRFAAWGIPADRTASGAPIIVAEMIGPFSLPSQWYLADLQLPSGSVVGATLPGLPFVVVGRTNRVAWAFESPEMPSASSTEANLDGMHEEFLEALIILARSSDPMEAVENIEGLPLLGVQVLVADDQNLALSRSTDQPDAATVSLPGFRSLRLDTLVERQTVFSLDSVVAVQQDTISATARTLLPLIAGELWFQNAEERNGIDEAGDMRSDILDRLARWNGEMDRQAPEPLIYWAWVRALQRRILEDEFPATDYLWEYPNPGFLISVLSNSNGSAIWCDIRQSGRLETCAEMSSKALDDAIEWIIDRHGKGPAEWYWGSEHEVIMEWSALLPSPFVNGIAGLKAMTSGDPDTQKVFSFSGLGFAPFRSRHGSNFQAVMSFSEENASRFITPAGQSGHPLSRYYDNFLARWALGDYLTMITNVALAKGAAAGNNRLSPIPAATQR